MSGRQGSRLRIRFVTRQLRITSGSDEDGEHEDPVDEGDVEMGD